MSTRPFGGDRFDRVGDGGGSPGHAQITVRMADDLAIRAHGESTMRSGGRFLDHVRRVAAHFDPVADLDAVVAALLHDTVEKGAFEFDDLRAAGVGEPIITIVDALTERDDEPEETYLARCAAHPVALRIKRVDIADKLGACRDAVDQVTAVRIRVGAGRRRDLLERLAAGRKIGVAARQDGIAAGE